MPHSAIEQRTRRQAHVLRRRPTDAEHKLWQALRSLKSLGMHFRRQGPVGPYIADFVWHAAKVIVEVDSGQHDEERRSDDERRTAWLELQGYRVLRFWNNDALQNSDGVMQIILCALEDPTPDPSPQGGGEQSATSANVAATSNEKTAINKRRNRTPSPLVGEGRGGELQETPS